MYRTYPLLINRTCVLTCFSPAFLCRRTHQVFDMAVRVFKNILQRETWKLVGTLETGFLEGLTG